MVYVNSRYCILSNMYFTSISTFLVYCLWKFDRTLSGFCRIRISLFIQLSGDV